MGASIMTLPQEVIQKIAVHSAIQDVLSLSRTCRHLRTACYDVFVLQECFLHNIGNPTSHALPNKKALRKFLTAAIPYRDAENSKRIWARLTAAGSQLPSLIDTLGDLLEPYESLRWVGSKSQPLPIAAQQIIGVLCTFAVLGYPTLSDLSVAGFLSGVAVEMIALETLGKTTDAAYLSQVAFLLALGAIGGPLPNNMAPLSYYLGRLLYKDPANMERHRICDNMSPSFEGGQAVAMTKVTLLSWRATVQARNKFTCPQGLPLQSLVEPEGSIPLPDRVSDTEDRELLKRDETSIPSVSPFWLAPSWPRWLHSNAAALIDDMASGEWVSYWETSRDLVTGEVLDPIQGIRFRTQRVPMDLDTTTLEGEGVSSFLGGCKFHGWASRSSGSVFLSLEGVDAPEFCETLVPLSYKGMMTPMGIVGF